jgi:hypothetical protein
MLDDLHHQLYSMESKIGTEISHIVRPEKAAEGLAALQALHPGVKALYLDLGWCA